LPDSAAIVKAPRAGAFKKYPELNLQLAGLGTATPNLLSAALACQSLLDPFLLAGFQVVGVPFHLFDDVLLLDLSFEATESVLYRLTLKDSHFSHVVYTPNLFTDIATHYREGRGKKSNLLSPQPFQGLRALTERGCLRGEWSCFGAPI
jgi:hypothetical protein